MTDYPKVSVVTITYGHENYITQTLDGVLMQDYPGKIEFIIANDNSPDQTDIVIKNYLSTAKIADNFEIKYTKHDANKGMMLNFLWALQQATGKYIALCEGDDYWTDPLKLQKQIGFLEVNEEYVACYHNFSNVDSNCKILAYDYIEKNGQKDHSENELKKGAWVPTATKCYRNVIVFYPTQFLEVTCGDLFQNSLLGFYGKAKYLNFNGAAYRSHEGGVFSVVGERKRTKILIKDYLIFCSYYKNISEELYCYYWENLYNSFSKDFTLNRNFSNVLSNLLNYDLLYIKFFFYFLKQYFCYKTNQILKLLNV